MNPSTSNLEPADATDALVPDRSASAPPAAGPSRDAPNDTPRFYWQLTAKERALLRAGNLILEDEGYLAHDINWGRRLLDVRGPYTPVPDVSADWLAPDFLEGFSDAISAVLQVAIEAGLDPEAVCDAALATCGGVRRSAAGSIRRD
jgi:hypothetical protein